MKRNALSVAIKFAIGGALVGALAACGGGGSGSSGSDGVSTSSGSSVGPVSGFGSVYVNGTRFSTDGSVNSDDGIERETQLEKGMILKVRGSWDDRGEGDARRIDYDDTLRGPLTSASWDDVEKTGSLNVAGQAVVLDGQTVFKGLSPLEFNSLVATDYRVRVSGWRLDDGSFRASFVGIRAIGVDFDDDNEVEIEGIVENLDADAQTFTINSFPVDYTSAVFDDDLDASDLQNGIAVEVEGLLNVDGTVLIAREIDDEDDLFEDDDDVEIAGSVYDFDAASRTFFINGIQVQVNGSTEFDDGLRESDLANGLLVKVEGEYRNGVLMAEEIEPRDGDAELEGVIESKPDSDTLIVSGVRVALTSSTLIEDEDDDDDRITLRTRDIESLNVGEFVEIEGRQRSDEGGFLEAIKIEREDDGDDGFELEGRITALTDVTITVMGLELQQGSADFSGLRIGDEVEVDYASTSGGDYVVVQIEQDD